MGSLFHGKKIQIIDPGYTMEKIIHQLADKAFFVPTWEINHLFLGTFNPKGGEEVPYYYSRRRNQTWPTLSQIFEVDFKPNDPYFFELLKSKKIACMDMILSVEFPPERRDSIIGQGYSDPKIINNTVKRQYITDKIIQVIEQNPGCKVYSTWGNGSTLREWLLEINKIPNRIALVSPSLVARVPKGVNKVEYILADWRSKIILPK